MPKLRGRFNHFRAGRDAGAFGAYGGLRRRQDSVPVDPNAPEAAPPILLDNEAGEEEIGNERLALLRGEDRLNLLQRLA